MRPAYLLILGLLIGGQGLAVDEDYYLPYTDNYGYVYDPETGQYVKTEQPPGQDFSLSNDSSAGNAVNSAGRSHEQNSRSTSNADGSSDQGFRDHLVLAMIGTMTLGAIGFYVWLRRRKAVM